MATLRFKFRDARVWRYMVSSIEKIIEEGVFVANSEGLSLRALDTSHVAMVDLFYPKDAFDEWNVEEEMTFGVSFKEFSKVLRRAQKNDELVLEVEDTFLKVIFSEPSLGERTFKIPQISLTYEKLPEPKIEFTVRAKMFSTTFRDVIKDLEVVGETLIIRAPEEGDKLIMESKGDVEQVEIELPLGGSLIELQVDSPDKSAYLIDYFSQMRAAAQAAESVSISYAEYAPVRVDMEYTGGGRLTFYVSPREE
jgi:proliferating cell nuclear antigen